MPAKTPKPAKSPQPDPMPGDPGTAGPDGTPGAARARPRPPAPDPAETRPRRVAKPLHGSAEAPRRARRMPAAQAVEFLAALRAANPNPETELRYSSPYTLLVAVVLSAQTTDAAVNRATDPEQGGLFAAAADPAAMVALGVEGVARHIRRIGLWQGKAKNVVALSRMLLDRHGGAVPENREALEALPGVGRKTASVVLSVAFGEAAMAVDTHIFRLGNRTGLAPGRNVREVEEALVKRCPPEWLRDAHHWLILHGRYVCKARLPECWRCVARASCNYTDKVLVAPLRGPARG